MSPSESANTSARSASGEPAPPAAPSAGKAHALTQADLAALAEKVYALLKKELRTERERLGRIS